MDADQMSLAVRTEITRRIPGIIESADLEKCTVKILQRQLEEGLKRDLGEHTDFIRLTVRDDDDDDAMRGTMRGIVDARRTNRLRARRTRGRLGERGRERSRIRARALAHSRARVHCHSFARPFRRGRERRRERCAD